ncbi:hypothetical protein LVJ83_09800 [Uruburuella testudinis]|uniref:Uncharacterized protein n=1 Tax=Uruburuella testudinis TaxID=1282863 RepID=A0ABY4DUF7_9NEIS|nr:hypothetical protein [Uruburuella testudinis]UOO81252.1 hypothetical protein LVJ83_09800 [Uruburuella testudinis]
MAHANPYEPGQVETLEKARNELVKLVAMVNQLIANQQLIQRDDDCLAACAVVPHTLSDEVVRMDRPFGVARRLCGKVLSKGWVVTDLRQPHVCR